MPLVPLGNHVLVRRDEAEKKSKGGIDLPDIAQEEKPLAGTILAVGPGTYNEKGFVPTHLKAGGRVLVMAYQGQDIEYEGEKYLILTEDKILANIT